MTTTLKKHTVREKVEGFVCNKINSFFSRPPTPKIYKHILPLGKTCEVSFQFLTHYGFLDSQLFNWSGFFNDSIFPRALDNLDTLFSGEIKEYSDLNIWRCEVTQIAFHGKRKAKELLDENGQKCAQKIQEEKADVLGRTFHLRNKLYALWQSQESQLFVLTVWGADTAALRTLIQETHAVLLKKSPTAHLCCVVLAKDLPAFADLESPTLFIRSVRFFSPTDDAMNIKKSDRKSWKEIWKEFRPQEIKKQEKKYKFSEK